MARKEKVLKMTMLVTFVIILSKLGGFIRDMVTAGYFGRSIESDAYTASYSLFYLPILLFSSCISSTLIPLYMQERKQKSKKHANHFVSNAINLFALLALVVAALMYMLAWPLVKVVFPGYSPEAMELTVKLTRIMMVALVFNVTSISVSSLLNAMEKYIAAQLTGFPLSICVIVAAVGFSHRYGVVAVAWGVFVASILQLLIMLPFLKGRFRYYPVIDFQDKRFHKLMILAVPAILSMGVSELNNMVDHALASGLAVGAVSALNYAFRLVTFLQGVLMVPLTTIIFSKMSRHMADNDLKGVFRLMRESIQTLMVAVLPIVAIAVVMSQDVVKFAYMRGAFGKDDVLITAGALACYVIGVPAYGMRDFLARTSHSLQNTSMPFYTSCLVVVLNVIMDIIFRIFWGANGLALATSISSYIGMVVMIVMLHKKYGHIGLKRIAPEMIKIGVATGVCTLVCIGMNAVLPEAAGTLHVFIRLAITSAAALIAYLICCLALRVKIITNALRTLKPRHAG